MNAFFVYTQPLDHTQYMTWAASSSVGDGEEWTFSRTRSRIHTCDDGTRRGVQRNRGLESDARKNDWASRSSRSAILSASIQRDCRDGQARGDTKAAVTLAGGYRQRTDELLSIGRRIRVSVPTIRWTIWQSGCRSASREPGLFPHASFTPFSSALNALMPRIVRVSENQTNLAKGFIVNFIRI